MDIMVLRSDCTCTDLALVILVLVDLALVVLVLVDLALVVLVLVDLALVVLAGVDDFGHEHQGNMTLERKQKEEKYVGM